jgi:protein-S-isoprenylcysteine O-methyltransferase Ste14
VDEAIIPENPTTNGKMHCEEAFEMSKKILPPTYLLIAMIIMLLLHFYVPLLRGSFSIWQLVGLVPLAFGLVLNLMADSSFHKVGTTVKPFEESTVLITDGVYHISRHPMYLGFVSILVGIAILLRSLSSWIIVLIFAALMDVVFIRVEERMLGEKFGSAWLAYKKKVRRWI